MAETQTKPRRFHLRRKLFFALALVVLVAGAFFLGGILSQRQTQPVVTGELISQRLADVRELATVEYYYTNMGRFENQLDFYGWKVPLTRKQFIISYDGVIRAGVDLSALAVRVSGDTVFITLPQAKILSHEIPEESIEIFDETRNLFNPIAISDYTGFTRDQKVEVEAKAVENGLLTQAAERARAAVESLLGLMPGMGGYTLTVR